MCGKDEKLAQIFSQETSREDVDIDVKIILNWVLKKCDVWLWTGIIWIRIKSNGRLLCT